MIILYSIIAFIVLFFNHKKYNEARLEQLESYDFPTIVLLRYIIVPLGWIIAIPLLIFWNILELIYNKINKMIILYSIIAFIVLFFNHIKNKLK